MVSEFSHSFEFNWRRPALKRVTSAKDHRWPTLYRNTYPGAWIGLSFYYRQWGLSLLWGRPGRIRA
jgi:hypothetical protein